MIIWYYMIWYYTIIWMIWILEKMTYKTCWNGICQFSSICFSWYDTFLRIDYIINLTFAALRPSRGLNLIFSKIKLTKLILKNQLFAFRGKYHNLLKVEYSSLMVSFWMATNPHFWSYIHIYFMVVRKTSQQLLLQGWFWAPTLGLST